MRKDLFKRLDQKEPGVRFDAVSCQFAIHYSWTSEEDARTALRNAACRLKPKGLFIGTVCSCLMLHRFAIMRTCCTARDTPLPLS